MDPLLNCVAFLFKSNYVFALIYILTWLLNQGKGPGRCDFMTYPDEQSESMEGQMQSYTVSGRRSLHETDV